MAIITIINCFLLGVCMFFFMAWIFRWLWNITIPQIFNLKEITYWQAFRLLLIAGIIFGSISFKMIASALVQIGYHI